jgi:type II secretory pathway component PulF
LNRIAREALLMAEHEEQRLVRLSGQDAALLSEQIAGLTRAGLPLASGLAALGAELPRGRLQRILGALARRLGQGASLDEAIAAQGSAVPAHLRGLVLAGERTGRMGEILGRFAGYVQIGAAVRRELLLSLVYPAVSIVFGSLLFVFILLFIVGGVERIFGDFGLALPLLTQLLLALTRGLQQGGIPLLEGLTILGVIAGVVLAVFGPAHRRSLLSRLPILGPVWKWTTLAEFCHLLGLLLESEVALPEAVPMAGQGVVDADLRTVARSLTGDLEHGQTLAAAMERRSYFPEGVGRIVGWAEEHRSLPETLHMLGEMFEARARAQASFASTVCTVLTVVLMVGGIVLVVLGVFIPLFQLIQKLSG